MLTASSCRRGGRYPDHRTLSRRSDKPNLSHTRGSRYTASASLNRRSYSSHHLSGPIYRHRRISAYASSRSNRNRGRTLERVLARRYIRCLSSRRCGREATRSHRLSRPVLESARLRDTHIQVHVERFEGNLANELWLHMNLNRD